MILLILLDKLKLSWADTAFNLKCTWPIVIISKNEFVFALFAYFCNNLLWTEFCNFAVSL